MYTKMLRKLNKIKKAWAGHCSGSGGGDCGHCA